MLSFFKHIAARLWLTVLFGGAASLWVLPSFQDRIGLAWTPLPVLLIMAVAFVLVGWVTNRWGLSTVQHLIHEAGIFERDGMVAEAETRFQLALAVFDSFLISPVAKKQKAVPLRARIARFYLARTSKSDASERFLISYLHTNPRDEEVAESWIEHVDNRGGLREDHQGLAYLIGRAQPQNKTIQTILARYYLMLERTDFPALQTYRRALGAKEKVSAGFLNDLAALFLQERRADEWALEIYLKAMENSDQRSAILKGIAACVRWISPGERNKSQLQQAYAYLEGLDPVDIKKMSAGFNPPVEPSDKRAMPQSRQQRASFFKSTGAVLQTFYEDIIAAPAWFLRLVRRPLQSAQSRKVLAGALITVLAAAVIALVINTASHLIKVEKPVVQKVEKAPEVITDPFTLQVAAYLKPTYAQKYVEQLQKQGLDAYWREAISADKKWYQVRISHFADKKTARDFGESLKARKIIDDYYVANYIPPK
ncbi:MAG: SPOR domain-containing protein [Deltaproteobacteria bacterium]|nr:SPOR domain-containing protein [Deltaproteobacteria bacterium]